MKYVFVKRYNGAYDIFLTRYFREGGIEFDENLTFREVEPRWVFALDCPKLSPHERLFCDYVSAWRLHPEARPAFEHLLARAVTGTSSIDIKELAVLEAQLAPRQGKLIFSKEEIAADISQFYKRYIGRPLREALDRGTSGRELSRFFTREEIKRIPHTRSVGKGVEQAESGIAGQVIEWIDKITPEEIAHDVDKVMLEHRRSPSHMRLTSYLPPHDTTKIEECFHKSEYVELRVYREIDTRIIHMSLTPVRGFNVSDYLIEEGWNDVVFPWYHAKEASPAITTPRSLT